MSEVELNLEGIEMPQSNSNSEYSPTVPLGIGSFTVNGITVGKSSVKGTPFLEVSFQNSENIPFSERFYLTAKAMPRVKELLINCGVSEEQSNKAGLTEKDIQNLLNGRSIRLKIGGEEWRNNEGKIRVKRKLPFRNFSESLSVPDTESKLFYNESRDIQKIDGDSTYATPNTPSIKGDDDLPF